MQPWHAITMLLKISIYNMYVLQALPQALLHVAITTSNNIIQISYEETK